MIIQIDSREKAKAIQKIIDCFEKNKIKHFSSKLPVGDYMNLDNPRIIVDRKQNLNELCNNVCQDHKRFTGELERANEIGIKLIILCEHGGNIKTLSDVNAWNNPRLKVSPLAVSGQRLFKILYTLNKKYGTEFIFCNKFQTGKRIIELLGGEPVGETRNIQ
jgi:ERCC4-type nuclease